ncbi:hypothetical protein BJY24_005186 [Nocardia transvalensis]|uniref:Uncharacterized protein n=1 Tax=Nocardia transvalensis TaxID=37333 RepID=A0A7W9PIL6_9NOCA|nr:hypothetical protein [Nocardia transvalensis]MBB5916274.1 hypothetical protein [Nocardia transvalensis]
MTETIRPFNPVAGPSPDRRDIVLPLSGYLTAESDRAISIRTGEGTWTFDRADVVSIDDGDGERGRPEVPGRAVRVRVRPGATADFTQRRRIDLTDRPMTLAHQHSPALGDDALRRLTEDWARELRLPTSPGIGGATFTFCQTRTSARSDDGTACDSLD